MPLLIPKLIDDSIATSKRRILCGTKSRPAPAAFMSGTLESTYIQEPPYFENFSNAVGEWCDVHGARPLAIFGDSVTTDHISPAGAIKSSSPAGMYLQEKGVSIEDFNSYGARRGNHEVMVRGTFANVRIRNLMVPGCGRRRHASSARRRAHEYLRCGDEISGRKACRSS